MDTFSKVTCELMILILDLALMWPKNSRANGDSVMEAEGIAALLYPWANAPYFLYRYCVFSPSACVDV